MTPKYIDRNEWYPVFTMTDSGYGSEGPFEFTDEELADYERVNKEFDEWQDKLRLKCR